MDQMQTTKFMKFFHHENLYEYGILSLSFKTMAVLVAGYLDYSMYIIFLNSFVHEAIY